MRDSPYLPANLGRKIYTSFQKRLCQCGYHTSFVRYYNEPGVQFTHRFNHTEHSKKKSTNSHAHDTTVLQINVFSTRLHRLLVTNISQSMSPCANTAKVKAVLMIRPKYVDILSPCPEICTWHVTISFRSIEWWLLPHISSILNQFPGCSCHFVSVKGDEIGNVQSMYFFRDVTTFSALPANRNKKPPRFNFFHCDPRSTDVLFVSLSASLPSLSTLPIYSSKLPHHYFSSSVPEECTGHFSSPFCAFKSNCSYYHQVHRFLYTGL